MYSCVTGMTGHQQNPTTGYNLKGDPCTKIDLESLCHAVGIRRVRVVDPYDMETCQAAIKEELSAKEPSVIISRRPGTLLASKFFGPLLLGKGFDVKVSEVHGMSQRGGRVDGSN